MTALARSNGGMKERAVALRLDYDLSVRTIAEMLGVPRSTAGGWVKGHGETREFRECRLCEEHFTFTSSKKRFCSHECAKRYRKGERGPRPERACRLCRKPVVGRRKDAAYCGRPCKDKWQAVFGG